MPSFLSALRQRALGVALTVASTLAALQLITPSVFDIILDLLMVATVWAVGVLAKNEWPNDEAFK